MGLKDRAAAATAARARVARAQYESMEEDVARFRRRLLESVDLDEIARLTTSERRARLERLLGYILSSEGPVMSSESRFRLIKRVVDDALGLGILESLLADESVTEIMVNGPSEIFVERDGRIERIETRFEDDAQLHQTIDRIVSTVNRRVDESSPMVDARLPSGERVNVIIPPLALAGATMTIRRFPRSFKPEELVEKGSMDKPTMELLAACIRARLNLVVSGGTSSGKTTMLNALSAFLPPWERLVTVEETAELSLRKQHVIRLEARPPNVEGRGEVTIRDLVRNSLRMRPDRIVVGEVRGSETLDMLQAMNTGHEGSLTTVHANSAEDALMRLATLASMSDLDIPFEALQEQINSAVDVIVHTDRAVDGSRRIHNVSMLTSRGRQAFHLEKVVEFSMEQLTSERSVRGEFRHFVLPEATRRRLTIKGETIPVPFRADLTAEQGAAEVAG